MTREQIAAARSELLFLFDSGMISLRTLRVELALLHHRIIDCGDYALRVVPSI